jgi:hypothetical protein
MEFDYNTQRPRLIQKEYGRNVQKITEHINTLEDREKRNQLAQTLTELMRQIHPAMKDSQDYSNKLWDDLFILSGFELDVDSPYPLPEKNLLGRKPKQVPYNTHELAFRHYGRNVELLIERAVQLTEPEDREAAVVMIGRLMKSFYVTWNRDNAEDHVIANNIRQLSKGKLEVDLDKIKRLGLFDSNIREREKPVTEENKSKNQMNRNKIRNKNGKSGKMRRR